GQINVGGYTFDFYVMNDTAGTGVQPMLLVDHNDTNTGWASLTATEAQIVINGGGILDLGTPEATYRLASTIPRQIMLTTLSENFDENPGNENIVVNITGSGGNVDLSVISGVSLFSPEDNDNVNVGMTNYGVLVKEEDEDNDPDTLTIEYPLAQLLPQVFVTFEKTVTLEGGAGTVTVERPQRIEIGSAVLASQVSDPSAANVVTVGGPCINSVTAEIMGLTYPACGADSGLGEGEGIVKLYESGDKVAIVVAGWEAEDTTRATRVLADYKTYQEAGKLVGTEVKVTGTSATEFTVTPVSSE
ncbi:AsmA family protein, partial [Candidatus Woesearchaeota archaeon]|nr:AsmA family protein [Candidatus Woesearchaeota archaeon]